MAKNGSMSHTDAPTKHFYNFHEKKYQVYPQNEMGDTKHKSPRSIQRYKELFLQVSNAFFFNLFLFSFVLGF